MSSIYVHEPPTSGKVLLTTTVGDILIELWSKETPVTCKNFLQLCLEGYYDEVIFHRIERGFIAQTGDPTGTGTGGESTYGAPFKDEIHSRLRFNRRGLVAMANGGKNDNASQFFFTFASTPELQGKHTIFGKVSGHTLYNMIKLEGMLVDENNRPRYPPKIISVDVKENPFKDLIIRVLTKSVVPSQEEKKKKREIPSVRNFNLLSFGDEAEEDENIIDLINSTSRRKAKYSTDLVDPSTLLTAVASDPKSSNSAGSKTPSSEKSIATDVRDKLSSSVDRLSGSSSGSSIPKTPCSDDSISTNVKDKLSTSHDKSGSSSGSSIPKTSCSDEPIATEVRDKLSTSLDKSGSRSISTKVKDKLSSSHDKSGSSSGSIVSMTPSSGKSISTKVKDKLSSSHDKSGSSSGSVVSMTPSSGKSIATEVRDKLSSGAHKSSRSGSGGSVPKTSTSENSSSSISKSSSNDKSIATEVRDKLHSRVHKSSKSGTIATEVRDKPSSRAHKSSGSRTIATEVRDRPSSRVHKSSGSRSITTEVTDKPASRVHKSSVSSSSSSISKSSSNDKSIATEVRDKLSSRVHKTSRSGHSKKESGSSKSTDGNHASSSMKHREKHRSKKSDHSVKPSTSAQSESRDKKNLVGQDISDRLMIPSSSKNELIMEYETNQKTYIERKRLIPSSAEDRDKATFELFQKFRKKLKKSNSDGGQESSRKESSMYRHVFRASWKDNNS